MQKRESERKQGGDHEKVIHVNITNLWKQLAGVGQSPIIDLSEPITHGKRYSWSLLLGKALN